MITNPQNEKVKALAKLHLRKERKETGAFLIEGVRFVEEACNAGLQPEQLVYSAKLLETERGRSLLARCQTMNCPVWEVEHQILAKAAATDNPQGIVAVLKQMQCSWPEALDGGADLQGAAQPFWLVVDGVQDPGNLGTIIRTAHAAGVSGICLTNGTVDLYNPKVLRSTMGSVFHLPILQDLSTAEILAQVKKRDWQVVVGEVTAEREYFQVDYRRPSLLVVGSEAQGPSPEFREQATDLVRITMPGQAESLNVAIAAGIILFEKVRQQLA